MDIDNGARMGCGSGGGVLGGQGPREKIGTTIMAYTTKY